MKTYLFKVVVEPDGEKWHAECPALKNFGAVTWGNTRQEAFKHIQEVVEMIVEELAEEGKAIPETPQEVEISTQPKVAVNL